MVEIKKVSLDNSENRTPVPVSREWRPFHMIQTEMNRLFDDFFHDFRLPVSRVSEEWESVFQPHVDVTETDKDLMISAELPGMDEKDVEVLLSADTLTIKGEKKEIKEEKEKNFYRMERRYGTFQRVIPIPVEIDTKKVDAVFKKGILSIKLPKTSKAGTGAKKISVKSEST
jgi:HSP20 family protein